MTKQLFNPNLKPIFEEERDFLKLHDIIIPPNCWKDGQKIYLNIDSKIPLMIISVDELLQKIKIKTNNIDSISKDNKYIHIKGKYKGKTYDVIEYNKTHKQELTKDIIKEINKKIGQGVKQTISYINDRPSYKVRLQISGGKDSSVLNYVFKQYVLPKLNNKNYTYDAFNTTNDTADTYKQMYLEGLTKENINNPYIYISKENYDKLLDIGLFKEHQFIHIKNKIYIHLGWYQWIEFIKNWWIPNALKRSCCSTYKEGQIKFILDKNKNYIMLLGVRRFESAKRAYYEFDLEKANDKHPSKEYNLPRNWKKIAPICDLTDTETWLYILMNDIKINPMYNKGFNRTGCLICPYASPYTNLLIQHYYPLQWKRWINILLKNYKEKDVRNRLKWTEEEFTYGGKWRVGLSKEYELLNSKKTPKRIQELADIKGLSYNMAEKYFNKTCSCGKKLNPDEIAMYYKMFGRYEEKTANEDNRELLCKQCLCKKLGITAKEYTEKIIEFRNQNCNLF